jgi:hypothetical protein
MATCCDRNNDWIHSCATKVIVYHLITYLHELKTLITQIRHSKKQKMQPNCHNRNNDENPVQTNKEFSHCKDRSMKLAHERAADTTHAQETVQNFHTEFMKQIERIKPNKSNCKP